MFFSINIGKFASLFRSELWLPQCKRPSRAMRKNVIERHLWSRLLIKRRRLPLNQIALTLPRAAEATSLKSLKSNENF